MPLNNKIVSPYIVGVPVPPERFYGYENQVSQFYRQCISGPVLQPTRILGLRRSGKTSFLRYIASPHVPNEIFQDFMKEKLLFVYLDLEYVLTPMDFFGEISEIISQSCKAFELRPYELTSAYTFNKWLKKFLHEEREKKLIILLDEFEKINNNPNFDSDFFGFLRSLASSHSDRLTWVTASTVDLHTLDKNEKTSPLWNIFRNTPITMDGLSQKSSEMLIRMPAQELGVKYTKVEISEIQSIAGRIPYFIQAVADEWFQLKLEGGSRRTIKSNVLNKLGESTNQAATIINGYWAQMTEEKKAILMDVAIGRHEFSRYSNVLRELIGYGLIEEDERGIKISGELVRQHIINQPLQVPHQHKGILPPDHDLDTSKQKNNSNMHTINVFVDSKIGQVRQNETETKTDGSVYIAEYSQVNMGLSNDDVIKLFGILSAQINKQSELINIEKDDLKAEVAKLCQELDKDSNTNEDTLKHRLRNIGRMAPDILEVALATITNPVAGFGVVAKKVAEKIKSSSK